MAIKTLKLSTTITALTLVLAACASRSEYGNLGDAGVAYSEAVVAFSEEAAREQVDSTSWQVIGELQDDRSRAVAQLNEAIDGCDPNCRGLAADLQRDQRVLVGLSEVAATARGIGRYFAAISAIANSTASVELQESVRQAGGNLQTLLVSLNNESNGQPVAQYTDIAATIAGTVGDAVVTAYLRREVDANFDFLLDVFALQSQSLGGIVRDVRAYQASTAANRSDALLRYAVGDVGLPTSLQDMTEWVEARRSALLSPLTLESVNNLQRAQRRLQQAFAALASTEITPERLAAFEASFGELARAIQAIDNALQDD